MTGQRCFEELLLKFTILFCA